MQFLIIFIKSLNIAYFTSKSNNNSLNRLPLIFDKTNKRNYFKNIGKDTNEPGKNSLFNFNFLKLVIKVIQTF